MIADKFNVLQMGMVAAERVFKVLDNEDVTLNNGNYQSPKIQGSIEFKNVQFAYDPPTWVLKDVSFKVDAGKTIALVGHTGSGKTSIISILNRLYPYQNGQILLDNQPLEAYSLNTLRTAIGVVLQDVFLFSGSIVDNITLRNPQISMDKVVEAAKTKGVAEKDLPRLS